MMLTIFLSPTSELMMISFYTCRNTGVGRILFPNAKLINCHPVIVLMLIIVVPSYHVDIIQCTLSFTVLMISLSLNPHSIFSPLLARETLFPSKVSIAFCQMSLPFAWEKSIFAFYHLSSCSLCFPFTSTQSFLFHFGESCRNISTTYTCQSSLVEAK